MGTVAVVGGTGRMGTLVMTELSAAGRTGVALSRRTGFDLLGGSDAELASRLEGATAIIDCFDAPDHRAASFTRAAQRLQLAAAAAGVERIVGLSIVGCDAPSLRSMPYYQGKVAQEHGWHGGSVPARVVRTTQWFEFARMIFHPVGPLGPLGYLGVVPRMRMRPVAGRAVARELVATADVAGGDREVAGPDEMTAAEMARTVFGLHGRRVHVLTVPTPFRGFADGALLPGPDATLDTARLADWAAEPR